MSRKDMTRSGRGISLSRMNVLRLLPWVGFI